MDFNYIDELHDIRNIIVTNLKQTTEVKQSLDQFKESQTASNEQLLERIDNIEANLIVLDLKLNKLTSVIERLVTDLNI